MPPFPTRRQGKGSGNPPHIFSLLPWGGPKGIRTFQPVFLPPLYTTTASPRPFQFEKEKKGGRGEAASLIELGLPPPGLPRGGRKRTTGGRDGGGLVLVQKGPTNREETEREEESPPLSSIPFFSSPASLEMLRGYFGWGREGRKIAQCIV